MRALFRLYPAAWRERYQDEVEQLLEDGDGDLRARIDLVRGAIDVQRRPEAHGFPRGRLRGWLTRDHVAGLGILVGAIVFTWMVVYGASSMLHRYHIYPLGWPSLRQQVIGELAMATGVALLLSRRQMVGRIAPVAIATVVLQGLGAAWLTLSWVTRPDNPIPMTPWLSNWTLVLASGVLLGVAARGRTPVSRRALVLLASSSSLWLAYSALDWWRADFPFDPPLNQALFVSWGIAWIWVGWSALRSTSPPPQRTLSQARSA